MSEFMIRFLVCNLLISGIIIILLLLKYCLKSILTSRMQYNLWFILLALLTVPLLPVRPIRFSEIAAWLNMLHTSSAAEAKTGMESASAYTAVHSSYLSNINDFTVSVSRKAPSAIGLFLCAAWILGILVMLILVIQSRHRLNTLKKSALPVQSKEVRTLYDRCLDELGITADISIYSTAFLKSPVITGLFRPCIYLPIHLISDYSAQGMRYMLLHELQHYRHKDTFVNHLINLAGILYWFHPLVWYALREMRDDMEAACDTSVLQLLDESDYKDYGKTLISLAQKVSRTPFSFDAGISGTMKQMQKRIVGIASYQKPPAGKHAKSTAAFAAAAVILISTAPMLSTYVADFEIYKWDTTKKTISTVDFSQYFGEYEGSFVLYDLEADAWSIYHMDQAAFRSSPDSTYKIYDALFGLEAGIITPENSSIAWNRANYPFESWNKDQDLNTAMKFSVNWYFQAIDRQLGASLIKDYIQKTEYGNQNLDADISSYWIESTLKISAIEQVQLLTKLFTNDFGFAPENIDAVKNSLLLSSSADGSFYGKTGTGCVNGHDVNGWFVGCVESYGHSYFFAANIKSSDHATGSRASEITRSILSDQKLWK